MVAAAVHVSIEILFDDEPIVVDGDDTTKIYNGESQLSYSATTATGGTIEYIDFVLPELTTTDQQKVVTVRVTHEDYPSIQVDAASFMLVYGSPVITDLQNAVGVPQNGRVIRSVALSPTSAAASTAAVSPSRSLASNVSSSKMRTVSLAPAGAGQQYDHRGDTVFDTVSDLHAFFSPPGVWKVSVANGSEVSTPKSAVSSLRSPLAFITQMCAMSR